MQNTEDSVSCSRISISGSLKMLSVGDSISFPIVKLMSVRAIASNLSLMMGRRYTTRVSRKERVIVVTRLE